MSGILNGSGGAKKRSRVYEKYLNFKQSAILHSPSQPTGSSFSSAFPLSSSAAAAAPAMTMQEITNSTDELELEAGEVVSVSPAACDENQDVNIDRSKQQRVELKSSPAASHSSSPSTQPHKPLQPTAAAALNDHGDAAVELLKSPHADPSNHASLTTAPSSAPVDALAVASSAALDDDATTVAADAVAVAVSFPIDPAAVTTVDPAAAVDSTVAAVDLPVAFASTDAPAPSDNPTLAEPTAEPALVEPTPATPTAAPSSPEKSLGVRNSFQSRPNERSNGPPGPGGPPGPEHGGGGGDPHHAPPDWRRRSPPPPMNGHRRPDGPEFDRQPMSPPRMHGRPPPPHRGPMGSPRRNGSSGRAPPSNGRSRSRSPSRHNNNGPPFRDPQPDQPQGHRLPPPSKYEPLPNNRPPSPRFGDRRGPGGPVGPGRRSRSPDRRDGGNFGHGPSLGRGGPSGDFRGPPGDFRGPPGDFRGPSPGRGPPPHGDFQRRSPPRHNGPFNGPPPGPGGPRRSRSRSPPRGGPGSRGGSPPRGGPMFRDGSPPRDGRFGPDNGRGRSPPRYNGRGGSPPRFGGPGPGPGRGSPQRFNGHGSPQRFNGRGGSPPRGPGRSGSPQRFNGRGGSPPRGPRGPMGPGRSPPRFNGRSGSPSRGPPGPMGPGRSPPRFGPPGPGRFGSSPRDDFRGPPPPYHMDNRGPPPPMHHQMDNRGPPPPGHYMDNRGPLPPMHHQMDNRGPPPPGHYMDNRGPPPPMMTNGHMLPPDGAYPPRDRSRSRGRDVDLRKRDRSWEREAPPPMHLGMRQASVVYPMGDWAVELKRSGKPKCRCRGAATGLPASMQLPLTLDVVQLPHLAKYQEFLMLSKRDLRRSVYELIPESDTDRSGYDEFRDYLLRGRNVPRAGLASEMDAYGYKAFILPPGTAARALGYKGEQMIAVIRKKA